MKQHKALILLTTAACLLPILAGLLVWKELPETMATHFAADGTPNGWSSKAFAVIGLPLFVTGCHLLCTLAISADPRRKNIQGKLFALTLWICPVVSWFAGGFTLLHGLGIQMDIAFWGQLLLGVMFLILGNFLPKMRQNYTMGIKLPWTMNDEDNWNRTHRMAGWLWMAGGLIVLGCALLDVASTAVMVTVIGGMVIVPAVYSYLLYRRKENNE